MKSRDEIELLLSGVVVKPTYSYVTDEVQGLTSEERQCLSERESSTSQTLPDTEYLVR